MKSRFIKRWKISGSTTVDKATRRWHWSEWPRFGWGLAWTDYAKSENVYMLVPFNWIFGLLRRIYWFFMKGQRAKFEVELYEAGYKAAREGAFPDERQGQARVALRAKLKAALSELGGDLAQLQNADIERLVDLHEAVDEINATVFGKAASEITFEDVVARMTGNHER